MGKKLVLVLLAVVLGLGLGSLGTMLPAAGQTGTLVLVEDTTLLVGEDGSVGIWVRNVTDPSGLRDYTIRIDYDPTMIEITGASGGDAPFSNAPVPYMEADFIIIYQSIQQTPGPTGDIRIAGLEFTCLGAGDTTLVLTIINLRNTLGGDIQATPISVTITQVEPTPTPTLTPTSTLTPTPTPVPTPTPSVGNETATPTVMPTGTPTGTPMPVSEGGGTSIWVVLGPIIVVLGLICLVYVLLLMGR